MRKKRILFCGESSYINTGLANYGRELLSRLHDSGRYELAELGNYGPFADSRSADLPWPHYFVMPNPADEAEVAAYNSSPRNQFGAWRFERALLDFRPDVVASHLDWWMVGFHEESPLRWCFKHALMPCVDATPLEESWLQTACQADALLSYTDWGLSVLASELPEARLAGAAPPAADYSTFHPPRDKAALKAAAGLPQNCLVVGTVMRNQKRKLYPNLVEAFARALANLPEPVASRCYLYLHAYHPDIGWDLPGLIKGAGLCSRALFSYWCDACHSGYPDFYRDARCHCRNCGRFEAKLAGSLTGLPSSAMASVYGLFDAYVQYSSAEAFGMPMVEAAACGVPVFAVDHSAMSDVGRKLQAEMVPLLALSRESETGRLMAVPNDGVLAMKLRDFLMLPTSVRASRGAAAARLARSHFDYDRSAATWMAAFDSLDCPEHKDTWLAPSRPHRIPEKVPHFAHDIDLANWGYAQVAGRPDWANSRRALKAARDLSWGAVCGDARHHLSEMSMLAGHNSPRPYGREDFLREVRLMGENKAHWEAERVRAAMADSR